MKTRSLFVYAHLMIGCFFLPLMLLFPLSGSFHIWGVPDDQVKEEAFRIEAAAPKENQEEFFREQFKKQNIDFSFEYIRANKNEFIFRPTSRVYYMAAQEGNELIFTKVNPNLNRRIMELHKGHGPKMMRTLEGVFGLSLILVTLSGVWLAITARAYRKATLLSFAAGLALIIACLI